MAIVLTDLTFEEGTDNMGGLIGEIYVAKASDVKEITVAADGVTATGIVMEAGKTMNSIYFTRDTAKVEDTEVGERDGGSFESTLEWFTPGTSTQLLSMKKNFNNGGFIFIATDANGVQRVVGTKLYPAYREAGSVTTGGNPTERRGGTFRFKAASTAPAYAFTGVIPLPL